MKSDWDCRSCDYAPLALLYFIFGIHNLELRAQGPSVICYLCLCCRFGNSERAKIEATGVRL